MAIQRGHLFWGRLIYEAILVILHVESICLPPLAWGRLSNHSKAKYFLQRNACCTELQRAKKEVDGSAKSWPFFQNSHHFPIVVLLCLLYHFLMPFCETEEHSVLVGEKICQKRSILLPEYSLQITQVSGVPKNIYTYFE